MRIPVDRVGHRYGRLLVVEPAESAVEPSGRNRARWLCQCDCGNVKIIRGTDLQSGRTVSCGCYLHEVLIETKTTHGEGARNTRTPEYRVWAGMIRRCTCENDKFFDCYGARGIAVCDRWRTSYENFLSDMGRRPSRRHSLDRIDNDGDYEPTNCRWATPKQQCRNQRRTIFIEVDGEKVSLQDACERFGQPVPRVKTRIFKLGWDVRRALTARRENKGRRNERT